MVKYDDAAWHHGGEYPKDLPEENAATHIGMFLAWCINNDLISEELKKEIATKYVEDVKTRKITGAEFLIKVCDEKLIDNDLSVLGQKFADDYYETESRFAEKFGDYIGDFQQVFNEKAEKNSFEYETLYHVEDTWGNYDLIAERIDERFVKWKTLK